ncbi:beta-1,4-glucuronyltransferase 1-like [Hetaerina americana]|uniref:beta-1,4-glucuronyltransferase 1-like n=1 Tax=Hetaerina americana TaxID=62018 RepID=UPI003A7F426D
MTVTMALCPPRVRCGRATFLLVLTVTFLVLPLAWRHRTVPLDLTRFHFDASGIYKASPPPLVLALVVVPFAAVGSEWPSSRAASPVCLATHASADRAAAVLEALAAWSGPASVALFDPEPPRLTAHFIARLRAGSPEAHRRVALHAIFPADGSPAAGAGEGDGGRRRNQSGQLLYPQNLARNTAVQRCPSEWTLVADADMVAPPSLRRRLTAFLGATRPRRRIAYVLPTYEVERSPGPPPDSKAQLMRLKGEGKARPFHATVFQPNQGATQLSRWESRRAPGDDVISVAHAVRHFPFWYEPVYAARHGGPPFDERFVGYGMTRNTQAYEMFLRGYTFEVLDNAFLIHWGFQERKQRPPWREEQSRRNYRLFQNWVLEKAAQYDADPEDIIEKMAGDQRRRKVEVRRKNQRKTKKRPPWPVGTSDNRTAGRSSPT